jgi:phosphatidylserine/phosphatidylglycerophosphate/cardiolipin synthase-like enzyme
MTGKEEAIEQLMRLPAAALKELGAALQEGILRHGFSEQSIFPFVGPHSGPVVDSLFSLQSLGCNSSILGIICAALGSALSRRDEAQNCIQLVLSGPEVTGFPVTDTKTTAMSLFEEAREEVLVTSYVFHEGAEFFQALAEKHDDDPNLRVTFIVDLSHRRKSNEPLSVLAQAFVSEFKAKHWPGKRYPFLFHDPRLFHSSEANFRGVLHAKTIVIDRKVALVTSANFTGAGQSRNIEAGVLVRHEAVATRLHGFFTGLLNANVLERIQLK